MTKQIDSLEINIYDEAIFSNGENGADVSSWLY